MNRPEQPPQTIEVGDEYSYDVDVMLNGELATHMNWIKVSPTKGTRRTDKIVNNDFETEEVTVEFKVFLI